MMDDDWGVINCLILSVMLWFIGREKLEEEEEAGINRSTQAAADKWKSADSEESTGESTLGWSCQRIMGTSAPERQVLLYSSRPGSKAAGWN